MNFAAKLARAQELSSSVLCVGLDPDPRRLPAHLARLPLDEGVRHFCLEIVAATSEFACAFKPNLAFFESLGRDGLSVLADVVSAVPHDRITIADGKRGDIGNTAERYAAAAFDQLGFDACTISPYMGSDAVTPFLQDESKAAFALVRTSNAGAASVQELDAGGLPLYVRISDLLRDWASGLPGQIGFVVGATDAIALGQLKERHPSYPFLIPGIGAQGGDHAATMAAASTGPGRVIVNSSRSIIYAGSGPDFAQAARRASRDLRDSLNDAST